MGLLMAFTFSGAASRFDHRRDLIVEEANDIGTAYLNRAGTDLVRVSQLLLPSPNDMFDIVTTRTAATQMHPPPVVWAMLGALTLVCSFLVGYDLGGSVRRNWLNVFTFALLFALTLYVIIDMEYPRVGVIRVTAMDHVLAAVRDSMR